MLQLELALKDHEKTVVLVDGSNLFAAAKILNAQIDYKKFRTLFDNRCDLIRMYYFTAIVQTDKETDPNPLIRLLDWLSYNGYCMITKKAKLFKFKKDGEEFVRTKGNVDIEIALELIKICEKVDHIILASGDGDFLPVVKHAQSKACKVSVLSTLEGSPQIVADELRRQSDYFIDLSDILHEVSAPRREETTTEVDLKTIVTEDQNKVETTSE